MTARRWSAYILLGLWSAWWLYFAVASSTGENGSLRQMPVPVMAAVLLLLVVVPLIAWRRPGPGGWLLVAAGLCLGGWVLSLPNRADTTAFLLFTLVLPPLVAGLLLASSWQRALCSGGTR
jgi:hypothetical protein